MSQIKVKNFGPIKAGLLENDGFIDVRKVTIKELEKVALLN